MNKVWGDSSKQVPCVRSNQLVQKLQRANETTWNLIGTLALEKGQVNVAKDSFSRSLTFNRQNTTAIVKLAYIFRKFHEPRKAIEILNSAIRAGNEKEEIWSSMGHSHLILGEYKSAFDSYQKALILAKSPKVPDLWYGIGLLYHACGCDEQAESAFTGLLKIDPHYYAQTEVLFLLGIIYRNQAKYQLSIKSFEFVLQNLPPTISEFEIWYEIGILHQESDNFEGARVALERSLKYKQNDPNILTRLGWLYLTCGSIEDKETGIQYLNASLSIDEKNGYAHYLLGRAYLDRKQFIEATEKFKVALFYDATNADIWCCLGVLYYVVDQKLDSLQSFIRAIRLNYSLAENWFNLGLLYESCSQLTDALNSYTRASEIDPTSPASIRKRSMFIPRQSDENENMKNPILPSISKPKEDKKLKIVMPDLVIPSPFI